MIRRSEVRHHKLRNVITHCQHCGQDPPICAAEWCLAALAVMRADLVVLGAWDPWPVRSCCPDCLALGVALAAHRPRCWYR